MGYSEARWLEAQKCVSADATARDVRHTSTSDSMCAIHALDRSQGH
jgi:hypothetical protein